MSTDSLQSTYIKIKVSLIKIKISDFIFDLKYNWIAFWKLDSNLVKASLQFLRYRGGHNYN